MRVLVTEPLPTTKGIIPAGKIVEIPPALLEKLRGKVSAMPSMPEAWLTDTGELRSRGVFPDLAAEIVRLTPDNLPLQRELLTRHCEEYDRNHIGHLWELWEERAAIIEHDGGLSRHEAEYLAAERLHMLAFLDIRAGARSGNQGG
jgi:hypothetical protein